MAYTWQKIDVLLPFAYHKRVSVRHTDTDSSRRTHCPQQCSSLTARRCMFLFVLLDSSIGNQTRSCFGLTCVVEGFLRYGMEALLFAATKRRVCFSSKLMQCWFQLMLALPA